MVTMLAGQRILNRELIYNTFDSERNMPYLYAPFFAYVMAGLRMLIPHERVALFIWFLSSYLFLYLILRLISRIIQDNIDGRQLPSYFYPVLLFLCLRFFISNIQLGQVNIHLDFIILLSLYYLYQKKDTRAGVLLAFGGLIKLPLFIFVLFFLLEKRIKALISCFISVIILLLLPVFHLGWNENIFFLKSWINTLLIKSADIAGFKNQSLVSFFVRFLKILFPGWEFSNLYSWGYIVGSGASFGLFLLSFYMYTCKVSSEKLRFWGKVSILMILMVISSPTAWRATFIHLLLPYGFVLSVWWFYDRNQKFIPLCLIFSFLLSSLITGDLFGSKLNEWIQNVSFIFLSALVLLFALIKIPYRIKA